MSESMHPIVHELKTIKVTNNQFIVIKIGGSVLADLPDSFYQDLLYLQNNGWFPIIVHGGGPTITKVLKSMGIESSFVNGLRVTDEETLKIVQMVLGGIENKELVKKIQMAGGRALGISGIDDGMILAEALDPALGFVGKIKNISFSILDALLLNGIIPVLSPLGMDEKGQIYNINADTVAQAFATNLNAKKIFMISDIPGIYQKKNGKQTILHLLTPESINDLKKGNQVTGGMIPKVEAAIQCLEQGVEEIFILDGREEGILAKAYRKQLVGTRILKREVI